MKHPVLFLGVATALAVSCSNQEKDFLTHIQDEIVFYASFEKPDEGCTKVYADENLFLRWNADDRISIFNKNTYNQQFKFLGETGDDSGVFNRVDATELVSGSPILSVVSVYPYCDETKVFEDETLSLTLPAEQHYVENSFGQGDNTMVSVSSNDNLQFKNVGGYLRVSLYGNGVSVSSISLKGNKGEKLAGKAVVTMPMDGIPSAVLADDATDEIILVCKDPVVLGTTADECKDFWFVVPVVTFSEGFTICITETTGGVFEKSTSKSIAIGRNHLTKMSPIEVDFIPDENYPIPDAVDLGLSIKWASFNLGASRPEEFGHFYAWGETEPYYSSFEPLTWKVGKEAGYDWPSYKWCEGSSNKMTKYCVDTYYGYDGYMDNKTVLDPKDDAAYIKLGGQWRIPTRAEQDELIEQCSWEWTSTNGVLGMKVIGPNGNSIFLPAAGDFRYLDCLNVLYGYIPVTYYGDYWSSSLEADQENNSSVAYLLEFVADGESEDISTYSNYRAFGASIRPVYGENNESPVPVESVSLDQSTIELAVEGGANLKVTISPENATNKAVSWESSNINVVSVSHRGFLAGIAPGTATITVRSNDSGKTATCSVVVKEKNPYSIPATPETVDLGLSVKWASFNLGATKPEEDGDYFAWGEIEPKDFYAAENYRWYNGPSFTITKYCYTPDHGYNGFADYKTNLDPEDDAASFYLGDKWRMPTYNEGKELVEKCEMEFVSKNGVDGFLLTGPNGNSLFFPASGRQVEDEIMNRGSYGRYYTSTLYDMGSSRQAWEIFLRKNNATGRLNYSGRQAGLPIRPVYGNPVVVESVYLNYSELEIYRNEEVALQANVLPANAPNKDVYWESSNPNVAYVGPNDGVVTGVSVGNAVITAMTRDGNKTASCKVKVKCSQPEAIDLGLSVKWASFNLGSIKPDDYGGQYAWGEVDTKEYYSESNYKWCNGSLNMLTKYCSDSNMGYNGFIDNKTELDPEDDAARVNLGGKWRMPTKSELDDLVNNCTWEWVELNGVKGCYGTGPNGNRIFFPIPKWWGWYEGAYWSSSAADAVHFYFPEKMIYMGREGRSLGLSIRPVSD